VRFVLDVGRRGVYNRGNSEVVHNVLTHGEESLMADNHLPADAAWLFVTYGEASVAKWVWRHGFRLLSRRSFALWRLALGVTDYVAPEWAVEARRMEPW